MEFLHGHLNNLGSRPACFFFRDSEYDRKMYKKYDQENNEREKRKFLAETDGPNAGSLLQNLKERIHATEEKVQRKMKATLWVQISRG